jgi:hypothetical protein
MIYATTAMGDNDDEQAALTTELDSHANMTVVGAQATIIRRSGWSAEVRAFSDDCKRLDSVPIVDAAIAYDCPYTMKTFLIIVRNALYVPSMTHNLITPFILREAGLVVNDVPRIHCGDGVTRESHCIIADSGLRIPLFLRGVFSYFRTRALTTDEQLECDAMEYVMLTPDSDHWDPYCDSYSQNEESFLDFRGDLVYPEPKRRKLIDENDYVDIDVSHERFEAAIDAVVASNDVTFVTEPNPQDGNTYNLDHDDPIRANLCDLSACFDDEQFADLLNGRLSETEFAASIGSATMANPEDDADVHFSTHLSRPLMQNGQKVCPRKC